MSETRPRATIRNAREADWPQMVQLLSRAFHRWPAFELSVPPLEHLRWKARSDPMAPRHQWVTEVDGRIVAMVLRVIRRVRVKGEDHVLRDSVDAAVDPRFQEEGIYGAMLDHARDSPQASEFDLAWVYSTNPRTRRRRTERERRELTNPIQVLEKPYSARAIVARRRERYAGRLPVHLAVLRIKLATAINWLRHRPYRRRAKRSWSIDTLERFDDRIDECFAQAAEPFDFLAVRSRDYMNWRYCDPAAGRFTIRAAEQEGKILGYLVFKVGEGGGYIVDLLAPPGRIDVVRSLVEDALHLLRQSAVELVTCWMISRHPYNGILRRYGFFDSGREVGFRYKVVSLDERKIEFLGDPEVRIHLMHGDSDWV
jgi:hypothetical protein